MRNAKVITIEGRGEVTVKEISPLGVYQALKSAAGPVDDLLTLLDDAIEPPPREIAAWYPSEIKQVVTAVLAVNADFFVTARLLRLDGLLNEGERLLREVLPKRFAAAFSQDT